MYIYFLFVFMITLHLASFFYVSLVLVPLEQKLRSYLTVKTPFVNAPYIKFQGWPRSHSCYESRSSSLWLLKYDTKPPNSPEPSSSYCLFPVPASFACACCCGGG